MGCWEPTDPSDELKDWSKALLTDEDRARYAALVEEVTDEQIIALLETKDSFIYSYAYTVEQSVQNHDDENVETFKSEYPEYTALVKSEIAYNALMAEQKANA